MDVFKLLKKEHDEVEDIFKKFDELDEKDVKERNKLFEVLKQELQRHMDFEEKNLFPKVKNKGNEEQHDKSLETYEEHHVIKFLLSELDNLSSSKEQWTAKLKVLKENIEHHTEEEENDLFPMANKILSKEEIQTLTEKLESQRSKLKVLV